MKNYLLTGFICCALVLVGFSTANAESADRFGAGLRYWIAIDDIDVDDVDITAFL